MAQEQENRSELEAKVKGFRVRKSGNPEVGELIYLPTSLYLSHGVDDFFGGLCEVTRVVEDNRGVVWIQVAEKPECQMTWKGYLLENQAKWRKEYKNRRGKADPDYRLEFNTWD